MRVTVPRDTRIYSYIELTYDPLKDIPDNECTLVVLFLSENNVIRNFLLQEFAVYDRLVTRLDCFPLAILQNVKVFGLHAKRSIQRLNQCVKVWFEEERDPSEK